MWLLANEGEALGGKRVWLRPGNRYVFGRTVAEPGQFAIQGPKANTVSRKHLVIEVDPVRNGDGQILTTRSQVTVEDLGSKIGTTINGQKVKGEKYVIKQDQNDLKMGSFPSKFTITWYPVVLSYSFTSREILSDPLANIQRNIEQLDIKYLSDYHIQATTHVISKKRNTSKGLQALINSRYIVTNQFVDEIVAAAKPEQIEEGVLRSKLECDFDGNWPDALKCLPAAGNEPVARPSDAFTPNPVRAELFEGYTFIYYDKTQFDSLQGPITNARGKALFKKVIPQETQTDDFIRYVKEVAGEKGLGEFEDGNEGRGVVVVRYLPQSPPDIATWYSQFHTDVSLRLDHRLIDQKDFLDAILACDASLLRRPLEVESQPTTQQAARDPSPAQMQQSTSTESAESAHPPGPTVPRRHARGPARSRFRGFVKDDSDDDDMHDSLADVPPPPAYAPAAPDDIESSQEGLFVSQEAQEPAEAMDGIMVSHRKRPAPLPPAEAEDVMDEYAPNAARIKRRRIEAGEDVSVRKPQPPAKADDAPKKPKKVKKNINYLEVAKQSMDEAKARAVAERAALDSMSMGFDIADIRRLRIEEPMEIRQAAPVVRSRDEDVADGRWNPAWNGRRNFKKFQQRGAVNPARPPQRIILSLDEVKKKPNGLGDDYWLEDSGTHGRRGRGARSEMSFGQSHATSMSLSRNFGQSHASSMNLSRNMSRDSHGSRRTMAAPSPPPPPPPAAPSARSASHAPSMDEDEDIDVFSSARSTRSTRAAAAEDSQTSQTTNASRATRASRATNASRTTNILRVTTKRPAAGPPPEEEPAKRSRIVTADDSDEEESDDELRFRFRKR